MTAPIRIAIAGALGRMGQATAAFVAERTDLLLTARFDRPGVNHPDLIDQETALGVADVVIDFTTADTSTALAQAAAGQGKVALVIGSTGFSDEQIAAIDKAGETIAIVRAGNFSLGLNMLLGLVEQAARALPARAYDIEVFEAHHRRKVDAPSGAALMLGAAAARGRGIALDDVAQKVRNGFPGARPEGEIGFSVMRGGGIVGDHSVSFVADDEILTLSHSARDRTLFARGAVEAALWVARQPPGVYDMQDVLGMKAPRA
jgi:4-hydroxy-tetrahydrodipicolinate reductase